jgi:hypothetical protein
VCGWRLVSRQPCLKLVEAELLYQRWLPLSVVADLLELI